MLWSFRFCFLWISYSGFFFFVFFLYFFGFILFIRLLLFYHSTHTVGNNLLRELNRKNIYTVIYHSTADSWGFLLLSLFGASSCSQAWYSGICICVCICCKLVPVYLFLSTDVSVPVVSQRKSLTAIKEFKENA